MLAKRLAPRPLVLRRELQKRVITIVLLLLAGVTPAFAAMGCGGAGEIRKPASRSSATPATTSASHEADDDSQEDRTGNDADDLHLLTFGQRLTGTEAQVVKRLVKRYFRAVAGHDGASACSLLYSLLAEAVPVDYGGSLGPRFLRGRTCAVVLSKLFEHQSRSFLHNAAQVRVIQARGQGNRGVALLRLGRSTRHFIYLHREHGTWKVLALLDSKMQ